MFHAPPAAPANHTLLFNHINFKQMLARCTRTNYTGEPASSNHVKRHSHNEPCQWSWHHLKLDPTYDLLHLAFPCPCPCPLTFSNPKLCCISTTGLYNCVRQASHKSRGMPTGSAAEKRSQPAHQCAHQVPAAPPHIHPHTHAPSPPPPHTRAHTHNQSSRCTSKLPCKRSAPAFKAHAPGTSAAHGIKCKDCTPTALRLQPDCNPTETRLQSKGCTATASHNDMLAKKCSTHIYIYTHMHT